MEQKKKILSDSVLSISGLVLMNVALQFAVYPFWERQLGEEGMGNILYLISLMNILAVSIGVSVNYARIKRNSDAETGNGSYALVLGASSVICFAFAILISLFGGVGMTVLEVVLFGFLMCATMWRYYADVEFKLSLNYFRYFLYYIFLPFHLFAAGKLGGNVHSDRRLVPKSVRGVILTIGIVQTELHRQIVHSDTRGVDGQITAPQIAVSIVVRRTTRRYRCTAKHGVQHIVVGGQHFRPGGGGGTREGARHGRNQQRQRQHDCQQTFEFHNASPFRM